jgi:hypothetical protein
MCHRKYITHSMTGHEQLKENNAYLMFVPPLPMSTPQHASGTTSTTVARSSITWPP